MDYLQLATQYLEPKLKGKYIYLDTILPLLNSLNSDFEITQIGKSVQGRAIHQVKIGTGTTKILMWSQMHGNEPTTTKGLFDFFNFESNSRIVPKDKQQQNVRITIIEPKIKIETYCIHTRFSSSDFCMDSESDFGSSCKFTLMSLKIG